MEELKRGRDARMAAREDMEMIAREQDRSQYSDWRRVEDSFHLKQAKLRSKIRLEEGRGKPIDHLARYIAYGDGRNELGPEEELDLKEPQAYLKGCSLGDYEDLLADIEVYRVVDGGRNDEFWDDVVKLATSEIKRAENARRRAEDVHSTVQTDILKIFKVEFREPIQRSFTPAQQSSDAMWGSGENLRRVVTAQCPDRRKDSKRRGWSRCGLLGESSRHSASIHG
jgi:hypothetical protein